MIVDTSAVVAVLVGEPTRERLLVALDGAHERGISAGTLLELGIVIDRRGDARLSRRLDSFLDRQEIVVHDVTAAQVAIGRAAYRDYGKGSGHPAGLNLGDCFAYALAIETRRPLLFVGDDFGHTDVERALPA